MKDASHTADMLDRPLKSGDADVAFMRRAVRLARRGEGRVEPNPMVGCVLVRKGKILAEGHHRRFGGPHAEIDALQRCGRNPRGSTLYVTLEPCCHHGKTPPCVDALISAGVAEVVAALPDPNPQVAGRGLRKLTRAGIRVRTGVAADEASVLLAPFATSMRLQRPYVIAKWAQGPDGGMTRPPGASRWISCEDSQKQVHQLRARVDAVAVGIGTVLADDPLLTARGVPLRRTALRVVFDAGLRIPVSSRLVATADEVPTLVYTARAKVTTPKAARLAARGVQVEACPVARRMLDVRHALKRLAAGGATNVLVEGGPALLRTFFRRGLVDEACVFVAPTYRDGPVVDRKTTSFRPRGIADVLSSLKPHDITVCASGSDACFRIRMHDPLRLWKDLPYKEAKSGASG